MGLAACTGLTASSSTPYAIVILAPPESLAVGQSIVIHARALNRSGDTIAGAPLKLVSLDPDTMGVDTASFSVVGILAGTGRAIVTSGGLQSNPFLIPIH